MNAHRKVNSRRIVNAFLMLFLMYLGNSLFGNSTNFENVNIRYNWAKSGLNLREEPNINSKIIETIPFAEKVENLPDSITIDFSVEITEIFSIKNSVHQSGLFLTGCWSKVKYRSSEGYVFDGYLSKFPPFEHVLDQWGNKYVEELQSYLERNFTVQETQEELSSESDYYKIISRFENGILYESTGSTGWYERIIIVPNMSMQEGILLFLTLVDSNEVRKLEENEKYQIYQQEFNKLEIKVFEEDYGIYQYGSNLIFKKSGSC